MQTGNQQHLFKIQSWVSALSIATHFFIILTMPAPYNKIQLKYKKVIVSLNMGGKVIGKKQANI